MRTMKPYKNTTKSLYLQKINLKTKTHLRPWQLRYSNENG